MRPLQRGKFYRTRESHYLWKTDRMAPVLSSGNKNLNILLAGTMVLFTKFGKFRYLQVIHEDMVGYIWCNTNISPCDHLELVDLTSPEESLNAPNQPRPNIGRRHGGIRS